MSNILDYVVIGGGIAGLYTNYLLCQKNQNGILLEKESDFGGRGYEMNWHGVNIKLGAGIMAEHNKHLLKLLKKLGIKINSFNSDVRVLYDYQFDMNQSIKEIKKKYKIEKNNIEGLTTKKFLIKYFGKKFTDQFIDNCEYRDYLDSDPEYFIKYYKIDDMSHDPYKILIIQWLDLVKKLIKPNCIPNSEVIKVSKIGELFKVKTKDNHYLSKKIYFALTLRPLDKLIKNLIDFTYSDYLGTVEFIRIYTWHSKKYDGNKIGHYNLVKGPLQKIIKYTPNILMASYSDNSNAKFLKTLISKDKKIQIKKMEYLLQKLDIGIDKVDDVEIGYWNEGVHYYKPIIGTTLNKLIKKLSKPAKNIFVVGEIISKKQGWVEGAIQSVDQLKIN